MQLALTEMIAKATAISGTNSDSNRTKQSFNGCSGVIIELPAVIVFLRGFS